MQKKVKVDFVEGQPYNSRDEMTNDVKQNKLLKISTDFNEHPVFSEDENLIFRAVHDYFTHIICDQDFSIRGEIKSYNRHKRLIRNESKPALFTEVVGQAAVYSVTNDFTEQKIAIMEGFDLDRLGYVDGYIVKNRKLQKTENTTFKGFLNSL